MDNNTFYIIYQTGEKPVAINSNDGNVYFNSDNEIELKSLEMASVGLKTWKSDILNEHFPRIETKEILSWIDKKVNKPKDRIAVVVGNAGMGKSVVMGDVLRTLIKENVPVLGLKLDQINFNSRSELNDEVDLGEGRSIVSVFKELNKKYDKSVLLLDQIDALSMSLSTDRRAINIANQLIKQINLFPNVKIVISCRKFDLDFDYTFQEYKNYNPIYIHELSDDYVNLILDKLGIDYTHISDNVRRFLRTPINLYLYSLVNKPELLNGDTLTLQSLYDELWTKVVVRSKDIDKVNEFLQVAVNRMYEDQTLSLKGKLYEDKYSSQIAYLLSSNFMVGSIKENIQFLHQSLFDYTYARKFIESGRSLYNELQNEHQGLFVRSRVRQVLLYMRDMDMKQYLKTLNGILFSDKSNGEPVIRFHLKMLVLNALGLCENISSEEAKYFLTCVLNDGTLAPIFIDSIYSRDWFQIIVGKSLWNRNFINGDESAAKLISSMCMKVFSLDEILVENYLDKLALLHSEDVNKNIFKIICHIGRFGKNKDRLLAIYNSSKPQDSLPAGCDFLRSIIKIYPDCVETELENHVKNTVKDFHHDAVSRFSIGYEAERLYDDLKKESPELAYRFSLMSVHLVFDKSVFSLREDGLLGSWEFYVYERHSGLTGHEITDTYDYVLDTIEKVAKTSPRKIDEQLESFLNSKRNVDVLIVIIAFTANVDYYKKKILELFTNNDWLKKVLENSSVLDYYLKLLFKQSFMSFDKNEQRQILETIKSIYPEWETMAIKGHEKYDQPLTNKGKTFAKFIEILDDKDYIKNEFSDIYLDYTKLKEKFKYLKTEEPNRTYVQSGWVGVEQKAVANMSDKAWLDLMRKYKDNSREWDFKTPTLTGICLQFKEEVQKDPQRYIKIIEKSNADNDINIQYAISGFEGLTKAKEGVSKDDIHFIFKAIAARFIPDVNVFGSAILSSFLRTLHYFIEIKYLPVDVFDFICKATIDSDEDDDANKEDDMQPYQTGINRARGIAGNLLVDCSTVDNKYGDKIFDTLESIAETASITTRAAIMINMANLNVIDPDKSLTLYLHLMHDYKANLMALPIHNLNPLVYYINYGFDKLIPLFKEAIKKPACHKAMTQILWLAFLKGKEGAENLFHQIINASCDAATTFFKIVARYIKTFPLKKSMKYLLELISEDNEEVEKNVSIVYDGYKSWNPKELIILTDSFVEHKCSAYTTHSYYECLKSFAVDNPEKVLQWILKTYKWKKSKKLDPFEIQRILEIITQSYNGVRRYNISNSDIESAMDVMDEILEDSEKREYLRGFLLELDNRQILS